MFVEEALRQSNQIFKEVCYSIKASVRFQQTNSEQSFRVNTLQVPKTRSIVDKES